MHLKGKYQEITLITIRQGRIGVNTTYLGSWQSLFPWKLVETAAVSAETRQNRRRRIADAATLP